MPALFPSSQRFFLMVIGHPRRFFVACTEVSVQFVRVFFLSGPCGCRSLKAHHSTQRHTQVNSKRGRSTVRCCAAVSRIRGVPGSCFNRLKPKNKPLSVYFIQSSCDCYAQCRRSHSYYQAFDLETGGGHFNCYFHLVSTMYLL